MILTLLVISLSLVALGYGALLLREAAAAHSLVPRLEGVIIGSIANFLDTLGIGSFAPTMAWFRFRKSVPDRSIPSTLINGYILPSLLQAVIFLIILGVRVDPWLMLGCIITMVIGGILGVSVAARAPIAIVQTVVGLALLIAAFFYSLSNLGLMPVGGTATSLPLGLALVAIAAHFLLGILFNFGVGNYAPTLAMLSLMGMDPRLAFPIMASGAGFAGTAAAVRSLRVIKIDYRLVLGMTLGSIPAVLVAAFVVKEMPLEMLRWLVVAVVTYAGVTLLWTALSGRNLVTTDPAAAPISD